MRILFITDQFPFPLHDGGNLRTYHVLTGLARDHDVTLVSHAPLDATGARSAFPLDCDVICVDKPSVLRRAAAGLQQLGWRHRSLFLAKNWSRPLLAAVDRELTHRVFDAIHFNHLDTAAYALVREWSQPQVFDTHNCLSAMAAQASHVASPLWQRPLYSLEAKQLRNVEAAICNRVDQNLVCSTVDAEAFKKLSPAADVEVIPNGVDTEYFQPRPALESFEKSLVFTGAMNYFPNERAAVHFCRDIMPRLSDRDVQVRLVGRRPSNKVRSLHDGRRVFVTGEVDDVRPAVQNSHVFIVPLKQGSGTRLKILEAFAMGKAVVSTSIGAEGIPVTDGRELLLADTADDFAACVDRLLSDASLRASLGIAARKFVVDRFDWKAIQKSVRKAYRRLELKPGHRCHPALASGSQL